MERCARAGVPETACKARSKGEIALSELDRLREVGVRFGTVLADAGYGSSAAFRHALDARGLRFAVGILCTQKVYAADVAPRAAAQSRTQTRRGPGPTQPWRPRSTNVPGGA